MSGAGQSNLSTGVAALLQDQLLNVPVRPDSPEEQDFLELDFDPGSDDSDSSDDSGQGREEVLVPKSANLGVPHKPPSPLRLLPEPFLLNSVQETLSPRSASSRRASQNSLRESLECSSVSPELTLPVFSQPTREIRTRTLKPTEINFQNNNNDSEGSKQKVESSELPCTSCDYKRNPPPISAPSPVFPPLPVSAVRSVPLTSPAEEAPTLNMPRSKSLNNNISTCLASESSSKEEDKILLCGNRLLLREALMFGTENLNINEALSKLSVRETRAKCPVGYPRAMIWSEKDASRKQVSQLGTSACGATAVMNVLIALNVNVDEADVCRAVAIRLRREKSDLPDYLLSRSEAGCNHLDLIAGVRQLCGDRVVGRFFPMYNRSYSLTSWLAGWISRGCVPVATLNVQKAEVGAGGVIADAWHHQMIWGVSGTEIFLTNPLQVLSEHYLLPQLDSPSELLVRREDVVSRFTCDTDLAQLVSSQPDSGFSERWRTSNVLGQVVNALREEKTLLHPDSENCTVTSHIKIPASYQSGITLFCDNSDPEVLALLHSTADFPIKNTLIR